MKYLIIILALTICLDIVICFNNDYNKVDILTKETVILQAKLDQANNDILYYRTQYLKANTQLIEIKSKCIYCAE